MTLRELEIFYGLSEETHLLNLSKKLAISQAAISLAIKSLEKKLSEPLFDRLGKKLVLNERGRIFKEKTYEHYLALKDAQMEFEQDTFAGNLKIASSKTVGNFITPQIVFDFLSKYPNVSIDKKIDNSYTIIKMVEDGEIDFGLIETKPESANLVVQTIGDDELIFVSSDEKLSKDKYFIDNLFDKKWILREKGSGTRALFINAIAALSKELNLFMEFTGFEEIKNLLIQNKDALTCISRFAVLKELERQELFEIKLINIDLKRELYLIYNKNKYQTTLFKEYKKFIHESCEAY